MAESWADLALRMDRARNAHAADYRTKGWSVAAESPNSFCYILRARNFETSAAAVVFAHSREYMNVAIQRGQMVEDPSPFGVQSVVFLALEEVTEILNLASRGITLARNFLGRMQAWTWNGSKFILAALGVAAINAVLAALGFPS